jgi:hypothetical protein
MKIGNLLLGGLLAMGLAACGDKKAGEGEASGVKPSPEMTAFMADFKGKSSDIKAALAKHGKEGLDGKDMDMYDMTAPKVIKEEKKGAATCYDMEAKAGMTTRTYGVCWEGGKISTVEDKGMK